MKKVVSQVKTICKSKTISEMIDNIPRSYIEFLAFIPLLIFMALPVFQLISNFIVPEAQLASFGTKVSDINIRAAVLGAFSILLLLLKKTRTERKPSLKDTAKSNIPMVFFLLLILMMIVSTIINGFTSYAKFGDSYRQENLFSFILYFAIYFFCSSKITTEKFKAVLLYTFIIGSLPVGIFTLIDYKVVPLDAFNLCVGLSGVYHQFNHYAYYLLMVILVSSALFIKEKNTALKIVCAVSFILNNIVLIVNDTFGCYIACFFALIFNCIIISITEKKVNKLSLVVFAAFILISLIMSIWFSSVITNIAGFFVDIDSVVENSESAGNAGTGRWTLWTHTTDYITEKPIFGFGIEGISTRLWNDTMHINDRPHNEFLQYAVFFGIPAAVLYVCGVFSVFLSGLKNRFRLDAYAIAALVAAFAYLVSSVFGNTMYYTAPYLFILLGIGYSNCRRDCPDGKNQNKSA